MGTQCHMGVQTRPDQIVGCSIHFDGYPEHMIPALKGFLNQRTPTCLLLLIRKAQVVGGMTIFDLAREGFCDLKDGTWGAELCNDEEFGEGVHYRYCIELETGSLSAESRSSTSGRWHAEPTQGNLW